jgi:hypothetical protein
MTQPEMAREGPEPRATILSDPIEMDIEKITPRQVW